MSTGFISLFCVARYNKCAIFGAMTLDIAIEITGGLSDTSKMPCYSYNLPAKNCKIGQQLKKIPNSVCNKCYALRGFYNYPNPIKAMQRRFDAIQHPSWVEAMTFLINYLEQSGYFRWHDSGDIQDIVHFENICRIAKNLPHIKFWLPTREYAVVSEYVKSKGKIPANLTVRLSAYMVDGVLPITLANQLKLVVSGVTTKNDFTCPSSNQNGKCMDCRHCWDKNTKVVVYKKH